MAVLILGLVLFLGVHSVSILAPAWRDRMASRSEGAWKGGYSGLAGIGLGLIVWGYGLARQSPVVVYVPPTGLRHLALLLLVPVFPLLFAAYLPGRIRAATRHPMLVATKLWALAHLLANGTLADVLLFGGFLLWAVADRISLKRRAPRAVPAAPAGPANDGIALVGGAGHVRAGGPLGAPVADRRVAAALSRVPGHRACVQVTCSSRRRRPGRRPW